MRLGGILWAAALLAGCGGSRGVAAPPAAPVTEPDTDRSAAGTRPAAPADGTRDDGYDPLSAEPLDNDLPERWWAEARPCPEGATLQGAAPPDGSEVWCARADGSRHGPSTTWHPGSTAKAAEGRYAAGNQHGVWTWWSAGDTPWRQVAFAHGIRHGRVVLWNGQGTVTRVEEWERGTRTRATDFEDGRPVVD
jgi:hypothetical protein